MIRPPKYRSNARGCGLELLKVIGFGLLVSSPVWGWFLLMVLLK